VSVLYTVAGCGDAGGLARGEYMRCAVGLICGMGVPWRLYWKRIGHEPSRGAQISAVVFQDWRYRDYSDHLLGRMVMFGFLLCLRGGRRGKWLVLGGNG
jgi:hypothetical protein